MSISKRLAGVAVVAVVAGLWGTVGYAAATTTASTSTATAVADSCPLPGFGPGKDYHPKIDPEDFSPKVTNPLFPQVPGRTYVYTGTKDGKAALDVVTPTSKTRVIDGVTTRVVQDRLYLDNLLEERTADYYAQDECGNVWYFGEDTATLDENGQVVDTEGSFHAGTDGAQPGVFMEAKPEIGRWFRQEWFAGHAEDQFRALSVTASVKVPAGSFKNVLQTEEKTALEPGVIDNKYFVRGIGEVEELAVKGGTEKLVLVEIIS
jgi:hypothetical protein